MRRSAPSGSTFSPCTIESGTGPVATCSRRCSSHALRCRPSRSARRTASSTARSLHPPRDSPRPAPSSRRLPRASARPCRSSGSTTAAHRGRSCGPDWLRGLRRGNRQRLGAVRLRHAVRNVQRRIVARAQVGLVRVDARSARSRRHRRRATARTGQKAISACAARKESSAGKFIEATVTSRSCGDR